MSEVKVILGDSREVLKTFPDTYFDAVVCDPPYALVSIVKRFGKEGSAPAKEGSDGRFARASKGFMSQSWDNGDTAHDPEFWREVYRVLKPGAHVVAFAGTRTYHRLACAIEDAGFEIRDMVSWIYGSGFPKSHDVAKGIDRAADYRLQSAIRRAAVEAVEGAGLTLPSNSRHDWTTAEHAPGDKWWATFQTWLPSLSDTERQRVEGAIVATVQKTAGWFTNRDIYTVTAPAQPESIRWNGWGTALKPALEPIVLARKPLGTSGVNVREMVEFGLRNQGVKGDILWTSGPANAAVKPSHPRRSSSTGAPPAAATSVETADAFEIGNVGGQTQPSFGNGGTAGPPETVPPLSESEQAQTPASAKKSSPPTDESAPVAESKKSASSPSITSMEEERRTGAQLETRSTPLSGESDFLPAIESFVGIVTGLTGSSARVHINRNPDGSFAWPKGLPKRLDPQPLTVAANVLKWGTGALNIDGCRVGDDVTVTLRNGDSGGNGAYGRDERKFKRENPPGRWPANCCHDGSDEVIEAFPASDGGHDPASGKGSPFGGVNESPRLERQWSDSGSAARFFYTAKADAEDRLGSKHPTVKPVSLMRWLVRLVTPGGRVLDPFAGSGTTGLACIAEGLDAILIEREAEYFADIERRLAWARGEGALTAQESTRQKQLPPDGLFDGLGTA